MQLGGKGSSGYHRIGQNPNNELICLLMPVTLYCTLGFERNIFWISVAGSNKKQCLLIKTTYAVPALSVQLILRIYFAIE